MATNDIVSVDTIWSEIKSAYNPTFLEKLIEIPSARVYAFGGIVIDSLLGKKWKDLDIRVILDLESAERDRIVLAVLEQYTNVIQTFSFVEGTVYRVKVPNGKDMIIDVGIANSLQKFRSDFKACALFVDLKTGELVEQGESCIKDFHDRVIRTLDKPEAQLEFEPRIMFRALKFAAKSGFSIDPELGRIMKEKTALIQNALQETVSHIQKGGKDSVTEYYLGNIFGGLKSNAALYVELLFTYGFIEEMCLYLQKLCGEKKEIVVKNNAGAFKELTTLEDKLSLLFSTLAKSISDSPAHCFECIKKTFALNTDRSDGNEFVINSAQLVFTP
jgi:tRNA nucleotidyltransferase/poly(A) polymerase